MAEGQGFPARERLRKRTEFLRVYGVGDKVYTPHFVLYLMENGLGYHRLGITVSRKVGGAVVRNRLKRLIREVFRKTKKELAPSCDVVVNVKKAAGEADYAQLLESWQRAWLNWKKRRHDAALG